MTKKETLQTIIDDLSKFYINNQDDFAEYVMERDELKDGGYEIDTIENARITLDEMSFEGDFENTIWESAYLKGIHDTIWEIKKHILNSKTL